MRYIAVFLVLINIGYFAWSQLGPEQSAQSVPGASQPLLNSGLTLVSEYQQQLANEVRTSCFSVASFDTLDDAASFVVGIDENRFDASLVPSGAPLDSQYQVYLPPFSSRGVATITLDSLSDSLSAAAMEIETYLITRGSLENAIALGVFTEFENALNVQESVATLGYSAEIKEVPRSSDEIQVHLIALESDVLENPEWLELTVGGTDLIITENLCETIAHEV